MTAAIAQVSDKEGRITHLEGGKQALLRKRARINSDHAKLWHGQPREGESGLSDDELLAAPLGDTRTAGLAALKVEGSNVNRRIGLVDSRLAEARTDLSKLRDRASRELAQKHQKAQRKLTQARLDATYALMQAIRDEQAGRDAIVNAAGSDAGLHLLGSPPPSVASVDAQLDRTLGITRGPYGEVATTDTPKGLRDPRKK